MEGGLMLIVFEGLDGVGKSTVVDGVCERLQAVRHRSPAPWLEDARRRARNTSDTALEACYEFANVVASEELRAMEGTTVVMDRFAISTEARRLAQQWSHSVEFLERLATWTWPKHLIQPDLNVHLRLEEHERQERIRTRGEELTRDERRLASDGTYRTAVTAAFGTMCDLTIDISGLSPEGTIEKVVRCLMADERVCRATQERAAPRFQDMDARRHGDGFVLEV